MTIPTNRTQTIEAAFDDCLGTTDLAYPKYTGKVRDCYDLGDALALITTDRQSAFDRPLAKVPFKGQVLSTLSAWWFKQTEAIVPNHLIEVLNPNCLIVKPCKIFPIEVVVRSYITGTTNTAMWTLYQQGQREFFGQTLEEGLVKNSPLSEVILTPTTKEADHDRPLQLNDIESGEWIDPKDWNYISQKALELFAYGQAVADKAGLILVDTKFEFGRLEDGTVVLADECLTPDSSRYWLKETYQSNMSQQKEPDNFDKEILRLWFKAHCDPYHDEVLPQAPTDLIVQVSSAYIELYERLTGQAFDYRPQSSIAWDGLEHWAIHERKH